jgi:thiol-disulfide isomerase/thioredoxin
MPNCVVNCKESTKILKDILEKQHDKIIVFYHMNGCPHCVSFMPIFENLLRQKQELLDIANIFSVEINDFKFLPEPLKQVNGFPHIVSYNYSDDGNELKKKEFTSQRTPENLEKFIYENKSFNSPSNTSSKTLSKTKSSKRLLKKL